MEKYTAVEMEVILFKAADVITTSGCEGELPDIDY